MTEDAILRAIHEEPAEDVHRLVYADWLDDHGGPAGAARAEFIRAQIEFVRLPHGDPRRTELHLRWMELLDLHGGTWMGRLPALKGIIWHRFWRGFVSGADVQAWQHFRTHVDAVFAAAPAQFLRVFSFGPSACARLATSPHLTLLLGLEFIDGKIGNEGATALAASPHLAELRVLTARGPLLSCLRPSDRPRIGDAGALALAASPHLERLERLDLRNNAIGPDAAQALRDRFGTGVLL